MPARSVTVAVLRAGVAATTFLTRVPLGARLDVRALDVARGAALFPVVGAGIGAAVGLVGVGLHHLVPPLVAATIAVAVEIVLTGGIHLDALADAADGLGAGSRERALEVMREPSIGAFGAAALVLVLLARTAAVAALIVGPRAVFPLLAAYAAGRAAPLALALALPYARETAGSGRVLANGGRVAQLIGLALAAAVAAAAARLEGAAAIGGAASAAALVGWAAWRKIRGVTGDVLGASVEIATTLALVAALIAR